jgi:hypothetical protein
MMVTFLLSRQLKQPDEKKEPEPKPTEEPKDSDAEQKDASETKQAEEKVTLHPVTTTKWRVENSWGDDKEKGYLMMSDKWLVALDLIRSLVCATFSRSGGTVILLRSLVSRAGQSFLLHSVNCS